MFPRVISWDFQKQQGQAGHSMLCHLEEMITDSKTMGEEKSKSFVPFQVHSHCLVSILDLLMSKISPL